MYLSQTNRRSSFITPNKIPVYSVNNIIRVMGERKRTFAAFTFKKAELDDQKNIQPFLKDLTGKENTKGSMFVNELWQDNNLIAYIRSAKFDKAKRMLKRLANEERSRPNSEQKIESLWKYENEMKNMINSLNGDERLRLHIRNKFKHDNTVIKLADQLVKQFLSSSLSEQWTQKQKQYRKLRFLKPNQEIYLTSLGTDIEKPQKKTLIKYQSFNVLY